jgi:AcrR family transcriptional regulator
MTTSERPRRERLPNQLPPGRHGLPRSFIVSNQRDRIFAAIAEATSDKGYTRASVEDVLARAGVSRRTFYDMFDNKEHAFLAAYDEAVTRLIRDVGEAQRDETTFAARMTAILRELLGLLAGSPAFARMCIVEGLAAGPEALRRRDKAMEAFAALVDANARELVGPAPLAPLTAETVVGGVYEALYSRISTGRTDELPELLPDLLYATLLPYFGKDEAAAARRSLIAERRAAAEAQGSNDSNTPVSRSFVVRNQRERIFAALAEAASAEGFPQTTVEHIVARAALSRRTFYEMFENKEDAFLSAYDEAAGRLICEVREAQRTETGFAGRMTAMLRTFLELLAASPAFARMCIVEVLAAGPVAIRRRNETMAAFAMLIQNAAQDVPGRQPPPTTAEILVGGIHNSVYRRIARDETAELPGLLPELVHTALVPYLGEEAATDARGALRDDAAEEPAGPAAAA